MISLYITIKINHKIELLFKPITNQIRKPDEA